MNDPNPEPITPPTAEPLPVPAVPPVTVPKPPAPKPDEVVKTWLPGDDSAS